MKFQITGFIGMNNLQNAKRLKSPVVGRPVDTAECVLISNFDIDDTVSAITRPGKTLTYAGAVEDMWATADESQCYFRIGTTLYRLMPDLVTAVPVWILGSTLPLSFTEINYLIACSNGFDLFVIENGVASYFKAQTTNFKETVQAGHILACYDRRLYIAIGNELYFTDADDIDRLDERDDPFAFNSRITMVLPLDNGMYVAADKVYWLPGKGPDDFAPFMAYDGKVVENSGVMIDGTLMGSSGKFGVFTATDGICIGSDGGQVTNVTLNKISFVDGHRGSAMIRKNGDFNQYIAWV